LKKGFFPDKGNPRAIVVRKAAGLERYEMAGLPKEA
jgi:hypothetical protein